MDDALVDDARVLDIATPRWALPLLDAARYKGAFGGRGSGKSHLFAEMVVDAHVADGNRSTVCVREIQNTLRESVKRLIEDKIAALDVSDHFDIQENTILSRHGAGRIIFVGMQNHTATSIKSLEGFDCAWVEEAQTLSQSSLDLLRPTIRREGSELWFTWNPTEPDDAVELLLRGKDKPPGAVVVEVNYEQNPWFPEVLRVEMDFDRARNPAKFNHVWRGGFVPAVESRWLPSWLPATPRYAGQWVEVDGIGRIYRGWTFYVELKDLDESTVAGVDVGAGLGLDSSAIAIRGRRTRRLIATYVNNAISIPAFESLIETAAQRFRCVAVRVEKNGVGEGVVQHLAANSSLPLVVQNSNAGEKHTRMMRLRELIVDGDLPIGEEVQLEARSSRIIKAKGPHGSPVYEGRDDLLNALSFADKQLEAETVEAPPPPPKPDIREVFDPALRNRRRVKGSA